MIRQTLALLLDAYRDLNARKLFWVTLILSAVFTLSFAAVSYDSTGIEFLKWHAQVPNPKAFYTASFTLVIIDVWLTWVATILALISTAGIFPDFISGGSIDLYLSKPISRARLFLTKYLSGLLFVTLQVIVVVVGGFLIFRIRGHEWLPSLLLGIPIVVCFYSYIFGICAFFGVVTRSTIASLLLTLLCWTGLAVVDYLEPRVLVGKDYYQHMRSKYQAEAESDESALHRAEQKSNPLPLSASRLRDRADSSRKKADEMESWERILNVTQQSMYYAKAITPKTGDTVNLLDRYLLSDADVTAGAEQRRSGQQRTFSTDDNESDLRRDAIVDSSKEGILEVRSRSVAWVIGTSLAFELVVVFWAGWIFCRRDY